MGTSTSSPPFLSVPILMRQMAVLRRTRLPFKPTSDRSAGGVARAASGRTRVCAA